MLKVTLQSTILETAGLKLRRDRRNRQKYSGKLVKRSRKAHVQQATKLSNFIAQLCLTWQVAQLLTSRATNILDRNHLYSSSISRSVTEL